MKKLNKIFRRNNRSLLISQPDGSDAYYDFALIASNSCYVKPTQMQVAKVTISRYLKKNIKGTTDKAKKDKPTDVCSLSYKVALTHKGLGGRMGRGKGSIRRVSSLIRPNNVLFKFRNVPKGVVSGLSRRLNLMLPMKCKSYKL